MALVHENIKSILKEVEKFLTETIKNDKLSSSTKKHKEEILEKLSTLRKDYPAWSWHSTGPNISGGGDESSLTGGSNTEDEEITSAGSHIIDLAADNTEGVTKAGYLDKFKKGPLKLLGKGKWKPTQQYCVLRKGIMYMYDKEKQKKQNDAFNLTEYELRDGSELVKDSKKDLTFELTCPGKQTHTFSVKSEDDYISWKTTMENSIAGIDEAIDNQDLYEALDDVMPAEDKKVKDLPPPPPPDEVYDDAMTAPVIQEEPEETYDDASSFQPTQGIPDDIYDDISAEQPPAIEQRPPLPPPPDSLKTDDAPPPIPSRNLPKQIPPVLPPPIPPEDDHKGEDEMPDLPPELPPERKRSTAVPQRPPPALPHVPDLPLPPLPTDRLPPPLPPDGRKSPLLGRPLPQPDSHDNLPLPPPPLDVRKSPLLDRPFPSPVMPDKEEKPAEAPTIPPEEDYENMFYGKWQCKADADNELSFKHGDIIRIINRDLDKDEWWIGELNGNIGLVPKTYLTPAYEVVVEG